MFEGIAVNDLFGNATRSSKKSVMTTHSILVLGSTVGGGGGGGELTIVSELQKAFNLPPGKIFEICKHSSKCSKSLPK